MAIDVPKLLESIAAAASSKKEFFRAIKDAYFAVHEEEKATVPERITEAESLDDIVELANDVYMSRMYHIYRHYEIKAISLVINIQDHQKLVSFKANLYKAIGREEISSFCNHHQKFITALDHQIDLTNH